MRTPHRLAAWIAAALLALAVPAFGGTVVGLEIAGGYEAFALDDVNSELRALNDYSGTNFGEISGGGGMLIALRLWPTDRWMMRLAMNMVEAPTTSSTLGDMSYDPMPSFSTLDVTYFFLRSKPFWIGLGAGGGIAELDGEYKVPGPGGKYDITGAGPEFHGQLEADIGFTDRAAVILQGGYRYAKVPDTQFDDYSSDPKLETDLTGPFVRIGFAYDWR